jgi:hypothetical protein
MSQFQSQISHPEEIYESEFKVLKRENVKRIRTNSNGPTHEKLDSYFNQPNTHNSTKRGIVAEDGPLDPALRLDATPKTDPMLLKCDFIGSIDPFNILIQFEDQLLKFNSFNLLKANIDHLATSLLEFDSEEHELNICTIAKAPFEPETIAKTFNTPLPNEQTFQRNCAWLSTSPTNYSQYLNVDLDNNEVTFPMLEILKPFLNKRAIHYLLFLFASNTKTDEYGFFRDTVVKFNVFLLVESLEKANDSDDRWFKKEIDLLYKVLFYKLKRKEFAYAFEAADDVQSILNIKDVYKLFERC